MQPTLTDPSLLIFLFFAIVTCSELFRHWLVSHNGETIHNSQSTLWPCSIFRHCDIAPRARCAPSPIDARGPPRLRWMPAAASDWRTARRGLRLTHCPPRPLIDALPAAASDWRTARRGLRLTHCPPRPLIVAPPAAASDCCAASHRVRVVWGHQEPDLENFRHITFSVTRFLDPKKRKIGVKKRLD